MRTLLVAALASLFLAGCSSQARKAPTSNAPTPIGRTGMTVDPVCGAEVDPKCSPREQYNGRTFFFCSENCEEEFKCSPAAYAVPAGPDPEQKVK